MPLRLVASRSDHASFGDHPVSRLRYEPRRLRAVGEHSWPEWNGAQIVLFASHRWTNGADKQVLSDMTPDDGGLDQSVPADAQAEREDLDLVLLAALKLDDAIHDLDVLLNWGRSDWKRAALARCVAKGWIEVHGDPGTDMQTFCVTPEGYRAADLNASQASL